MNRVDGEPVGICLGTTEKTFEHANNYDEFKLSSGVALFFSFLKVVLVLLLLCCLFLGYPLFTVLKADLVACSTTTTTQCDSFPINLLTTRPTTESIYLIEDILMIVFLVAAIVLFLVYRKWQFELDKWVS